MRKILFRAKAINRNKGYHRTNYKNGDWVYGLVTNLYDDDFPNVPAEMRNMDGVSGIEVDYKTIGQYTGLKDKNGKKIFEGDIVNDKQSGYDYFIKWFPEYACFSLANRNGHMEFGCDELEIFLNDLVVVGDIHDNPEFLKGERENDR